MLINWYEGHSLCCTSTFNSLQNNNLLEIAFDVALARAEELDRYFEKHHETIGPLHGLPVSMKDQFHIKGVETTMAYVGWIGTFEGRKGTGKEKVVESELVRELYSLGAIPIVKVRLEISCYPSNGFVLTLVQRLVACKVYG